MYEKFDRMGELRWKGGKGWRNNQISIQNRPINSLLISS